jgi:hypothetical protein
MKLQFILIRRYVRSTELYGASMIYQCIFSHVIIRLDSHLPGLHFPEGQERQAIKNARHIKF